MCGGHNGNTKQEMESCMFLIVLIPMWLDF
ncbi:hypothetical protein NDGK_03137 [Clostridiales bacterium CHKCI001]|nr:hypothetical protein NDGK_03137 [Clostridiales bacterium CHKCI001]